MDADVAKGGEAVSDQTPVDWAGIEVAYKAGQSSLREIGRQFDVSDTAIRKRARAEGWTRPLGAKVREAVGEALVRATGSQPSSHCEPRTVGRPSKYDPSYCDSLIEAMADGYSVTAWAGEIGVSRSRVNAWAEVHEEFREALNVGKAKRLKFWEKTAIAVASKGTGGPGAASVITFGLKNMGGDEWSDTSKQEVTSTVTVKADADDAFLAVARLVGGAAAGAPSRAGDDGAVAGGGAA